MKIKFWIKSDIVLKFWKLEGHGIYNLENIKTTMNIFLKLKKNYLFSLSFSPCSIFLISPFPINLIDLQFDLIMPKKNEKKNSKE